MTPRLLHVFHSMLKPIQIFAWVLMGANIFYFVGDDCPSLVTAHHCQCYMAHYMQVVGLIVIGVAAVARTDPALTTVSILGGIIAIGVFILILSLLGVLTVYKRIRGLLVLVIICTSPLSHTLST